MGHIKKVAIFLPSLQGGGAERLIFEELTCMKEDNRFHFEIHLLYEEGPLFSKFMKLGLPIRVWNAPHKSFIMLKTCYDLSRHLRRSRVDILHCHLLFYQGPITSRLAGIKSITTVHSDVVYSSFHRLFFNQNDLVLGCGRQVFNNISQFLPSQKTGLLINGISVRDSKQRNNHMSQKVPNKKGSPLIVTIGRLTRQKGYDVLIKAFHSVTSKYPEAKLIICGIGEDRELLEHLIIDLKMEEHIKLIGWVENVDEILETCDIYVNSSRWEGLPLTLLEAMAHSNAIVATNVSGNVEVILDGETGILVPPEDSKAIAAKISELIDNVHLRRKLGIGARNLFEREYTISKHCDILASYYLGLR